MRKRALSNRGLLAAKIWAWNSACFWRSFLSARAETVAATATNVFLVSMGYNRRGLRDAQVVFTNY